MKTIGRMVYQHRRGSYHVPPRLGKVARSPMSVPENTPPGHGAEATVPKQFSGMARIRRGPTASRDYTIIRNAAMRDMRLSRRARGLLAELLSHKEGWTTSVRDLVKGGPEGRTTINTALNELEEFGYLVRSRFRDPETGRYLEMAEYYVTDDPGAAVPLIPVPSDSDDEKRRSDPIAGNLTQAPTSNFAANDDGDGPAWLVSGNLSSGSTSNLTDAGNGNCWSGPVSGNPVTGDRRTQKTMDQEEQEEREEDETPAVPGARSAVTVRKGAAFGGYAAPGIDPKQRREYRRDVRQLFGGVLPDDFTGHLPPVLPNIVPDVFAAAQLDPAASRTRDQLAERVKRRWTAFQFDRDHYAGRVASVVGICVSLLSRPGCPDPRCEDGYSVDSGDRCPRCAERVEDRHRAQSRPTCPLPGCQDGYHAVTGARCPSCADLEDRAAAAPPPIPIVPPRKPEPAAPPAVPAPRPAPADGLPAGYGKTRAEIAAELRADTAAPSDWRAAREALRKNAA